MYSLYNNYSYSSSSFLNVFSSFQYFSKPVSKFIADFFESIIISESINFDKIATILIQKLNIKFDSITRRISRFLSNPKVNFISLFNDIVDHIFANYKVKHKDSRIHISLDHMFVKSKFTILMFSLRIGKQGIPIFFKIFPGKYQDGMCNAFSFKTFSSSIKYVHDLIKSYIPNADIIFLADRWFGSHFKLMQFIDSLGDGYVFRTKSGFKAFYNHPKEGHKIWTTLEKLPDYVYHSSYFENIEITNNKYICNLTICKSDKHKERWYLFTNRDPKRAKKDYAYRFGAIETIFKNEKSNGFYIEKTGIKSIHSFENMYSLVCIAQIYLTCLGTEVSKNSNCYKNIGFRTSKKDKNGALRRCVSLFRTGLRLFKLVVIGGLNLRLPFSFILYDI